MQEKSGTLLSRPRKVATPARRSRRMTRDQAGHGVMPGRAGRNVSQACHNEMKCTLACRSATGDSNYNLLWPRASDDNAIMPISSGESIFGWRNRVASLMPSSRDILEARGPFGCLAAWRRCHAASSQAHRSWRGGH